MGHGVLFTVEEDAEMWKFAMEDHKGYNNWTMWDLFIERTGSRRSFKCLHYRFHNQLLPHLPDTKFHVETKLEMCRKYKAKVDPEFLKELRKHAQVKVGKGRGVIWYKLKPKCPENKDIELSDEAFMEITSPIVTKNRLYTAEEDAAIWNYAVENYQSYTRTTSSFWKRLIQELGSDRTPSSVSSRFVYQLAPNMHLHDCDIEVKLELYKKCQMAVNKEYLKTLEEHAEVVLNKRGWIIDYKLKSCRAEKRRNAGEADEISKKPRVDDLGVETENLVIDLIHFVSKYDSKPAIGMEATEDGDQDDSDNQVVPDVEENINFDDVHAEVDQNPVIVDENPLIVQEEVAPIVNMMDNNTLLTLLNGFQFYNYANQFPVFDGVDRSVKLEKFETAGYYNIHHGDAPQNFVIPGETSLNNNSQTSDVSKILEVMQRMENNFQREMSEMSRAMASMKEEMEIMRSMMRIDVTDSGNQEEID